MRPNKWLALVIGLLVAWQCHADGFKLGYINIERVYREAKPAVDIKQQLDQEFNARRVKLKGLQMELEVLQAKKLPPNLSDSEREDEKNKLEAADQNYQKESEKFIQDFKQRRAEEFAAFLDRANRVVRNIAEKEHYDLILQDSVYVDPKYDMTDKLIKALDDDK